MNLQYSHVVVDCPVCGRPVEMQSQYVSHEMTCGHCRGHFAVYETARGGMTAVTLKGADSRERAEHVLRRAGKADESAPADGRQGLPHLLAVLDEERQNERPGTSLQGECDLAAAQPMALLVEHRDQVFTRIAADLTGSGMRVVRARSATEALRLCGTRPPALVVANLDLPDQSGWLLAGKLRMVDPHTRVWLYQPESSDYDEGMASYLQVDELLDHGGDLLGLSETIVELVAGREAPAHAVGNVENAEDLAAA